MVLHNFRLTRKRVLLVIILLATVSPLIYYLASLFISRAVNEPNPTANAVTLVTGTFTGADGFHQVSGTARVLQLSDGYKVLRFEGFATANGPDLFVYTSTDKTAKDSVNLWELKGNLGDQNCNIPVEVDLARHRFVLIWVQGFVSCLAP